MVHHKIIDMITVEGGRDLFRAHINIIINVIEIYDDGLANGLPATVLYLAMRPDARI